MDDNEFKIKGTPISLLKVKQIENEIRNRGGRVPTNSVKEAVIAQLKELLIEERRNNSNNNNTNNHNINNNNNNNNNNTTKKRALDRDFKGSNKKATLGDPKALQLEKKILNGFNFYPIVERLKFDELGFRLVKEYTRFIVVKILTHDLDSAITIPPPLIGRIWISHILDTNRYEELCKLIELKIHHNPDGIDEVSQEEKRKRYVHTMELYEKYFTKSTMDTEIWQNDYLLEDEDEFGDDDEDDELEQTEQVKQQPPSQTQPSQQNLKNIASPPISSNGINESTFSTTDTAIVNENSNTNNINNTNNNINCTPSKPSPSPSNTTSETESNAPLNTSVNFPQTPTNLSAVSPTSAKAITTPKSNEVKISIGFIYVKNSKKEITTFHGVGLGKTLIKVIKAYSKLKNINIPTTKFLFNNKPIMNETPSDLDMKDGDHITVVTI